MTERTSRRRLPSAPEDEPPTRAFAAGLGMLAGGVIGLIVGVVMQAAQGGGTIVPATAAGAAIGALVGFVSPSLCATAVVGLAYFLVGVLTSANRNSFYMPQTSGGFWMKLLLWAGILGGCLIWWWL
jgi:hypothetical protein